MKVICSSSMPYVREAFSELGEAVVLDGRSITADDVRDADIMAIRSTTKTNRALLEGSKVRFIGTATIGTDHFDFPYFEEAGIRWCYAPGCNANSVSEYIATALLKLANKHGLTLRGKTIGVVGVGNVGKRVVEKAEALGMRVLMNDPPRQRAEPDGDEKFVSLETVLDESDIITLHVPLTREGHDATYHLCNASFFERINPGCVFMNAARGDVVSTDALLAAMDGGPVSHAVIDTWESEPAYRRELVPRVEIATPHIAGYSFEGKVAGTVMVYNAVCEFLGVTPTWTPDALLPPPLVPALGVDAAGRPDEAVLWDVVRKVYEIEADDRRFRESCVEDDAARIANFDALRKSYPVRREFRYTRLTGLDASSSLARTFTALGFEVAEREGPG